MSLTKTYELSIIHSDPSGETNDVVFVSFFEIVGPTKKLVAQTQMNPNTVSVYLASQWAMQIAGSLVDKVLIPPPPVGVAPLLGVHDPGGNVA